MNIIKSSRAFSRLLSLMVIGIFFLLVGCVETTTIEGIVLSSEEVSIKIGEEIEVTATVLPAEASQKVKWNSEDTSIATVSEGKIKGVAVGDTRVRVIAGAIVEFVDVNVTSTIEEVDDPSINIIDKAMADANFINVSTVITYKVVGTDNDVDFKSTTKVDGNIGYTLLELDGENFTTYTIAEGNVFYTATYTAAFGNTWFVNSSTVDLSTDFDYLDEFILDDFTLENGYYVIKEAKVNEYLSLLNEFGELDEDNTITGMELKFKIVDNKLLEILYDIRLKIDAVEQQVFSQMVFSEYGEVKLTVPQAVKDAIAEYKLSNE